MNRRIISVILSICLLFSVLPITAFATGEEVTVPTVGVEASNKPAIFANGVPITIEAGTEGKTKIKYSVNGMDTYLDLDPNTEGVQEEADLSNTTICGDSDFYHRFTSKNVNITMTGGSVKEIYGTYWNQADSVTMLVENGTVSGWVVATNGHNISGDVTMTVKNATVGHMAEYYGYGSVAGTVNGYAINVTGEILKDWGFDNLWVHNGNTITVYGNPDLASLPEEETVDNTLTVKSDSVLLIQTAPGPYDNFPAPTGTLTIPLNYTLRIEAGGEVVIGGAGYYPHGSTLINNGTIQNEGTITNKHSSDNMPEGTNTFTNNGTIVGNGSIVDEGNGTFNQTVPTRDMIIVPENLVYTGTDLTETAKAAMSIGQATYGEQIFKTQLSAGWSYTISPAIVNTAGTYSVTYAKEGAASVSKEFLVALGKGQGIVTMDNWTYGETANEPVPYSTTNGVNHVTYMYKGKGADDSTYSDTKPSSAGEYTVKAIFAETANYFQTIATTDFMIAKADISDVTVAGNTGVYKGVGAGIVAYTIIGTIPEGVKTYYQWKLEDGSWSNGGTYWNPAWEGGLKLDNAGSITARVKLSGDNYNDYISDEVTSILSPKNISDSNILVDEIGVITDKYYTGSAMEQEPVEIRNNDPTVLLGQLSPGIDYNISYENNRAVGEASLIITGIGNFTGTVTKKFNIHYYDGIVTAAYNGNTTKSDWYTADVAITADGYTISDTLDGTYAESYLITGEGDVNKTLYFKQDGTGYITEGKEITVNIDKTGPAFSGEKDGITISDNHWKTFLNAITIGKFFNETKNVSISASDNGSGVSKYYYYMDTTSTTLKTADQLNAISFTEGDSFPINDENKYIIYAYALDYVGNRSAYICTDGIVMDKTAPIVIVTAPVGSNLLDVSATANGQMSETGTITYVIKDTEQSSITAQDILDAAEKNTVSVAEGKTDTNLDVALSGLTANTTYYMYAVGTDSAGNNSTVQSVSFTTTKTQPVFAGNPTITGTYGQQVKDMTVSQMSSANGVAGSWSVSSTDKPAVGTSAAYDVIFTPENTVQYTSVTVQVIPTIHPKSLTAKGVTVGEATGTYTYDGTAKVPTVTITDREASITSSDYSLSYCKNIGAGTATINITGTGNYTGTVNRNFTIAKAPAPTIDFPSVNGLTYGQKLFESTLTDGSTQYGTFAWTNGNTVPTVVNSGYQMTFTPSSDMVANYEDILNKTELISVNVSKATPAVTVNTVISDDGDKRKAVLTATVTGVENGEMPTGTVKFVDRTIDGDVDLAQIRDVTITDGKAVYTWSGLVDQIYKVETVYSGSGNYTTAYSSELSFDTAKQNQAALNIGSIGTKTYGDEAFTLSSTGGSENGAVSFTSSNPDIVSISGTTATIHKAGTVTITATKAGNDIYNEANVSTTLTVAKKALNIKADNKLNVIMGTEIPELTYTVAGLIGNDTFTNPTMSTTVANAETLGEYDILISGGTLTNSDSYTVTFTNGKMTVVNTIYVVSVTNGTGSSSYSEGQTVRIVANSRSGYTFTGQQTENSGQIKANKPYLVGQEGKSGWEVILTEIEAISGETSQEPVIIIVEMNGETTIPANVVATLRGKNINLVLDMGDGITWTINGINVSDAQLFDINLGVTKNTSVIPEDAVNGIRGEKNSIQIELAHNGAFGFGATLTIAFDEGKAGKFANLFYYNEETGKLEYMESTQVGKDGKATLTFVHASAYTIVFSNEAMNESTVASKTDISNQTQDSTKTVTTEVQIVDETSGSMMVIWILLGIIVVVVIGGTTIYMRKKKDGKKENEI